MFWRNYSTGTWFGWPFMVFFGMMVVLVFVLLLQEMIKKEKGSEQKETPLEILKKRYNKGEISKKEFEKIKNDIMKS